MSDRQLVICELGQQQYGLDIGRVREIIRVAPISPLHGAPAEVEGVINLRGRIIPVVDLAARFGLRAADRGAAARIVVAESGAGPVGLVVDGVTEVRAVPEDGFEPTPALAGDTPDLAGIVRVDERLITLIALDHLVVERTVVAA